MRISAFTSKGEGNISESILVSTDEDGKEYILALCTQAKMMFVVLL